jgi:hypothetical protein
MAAPFIIRKSGRHFPNYSNNRNFRKHLPAKDVSIQDGENRIVDK